jgi:hypothetical protein
LARIALRATAAARARVLPVTRAAFRPAAAPRSPAPVQAFERNLILVRQRGWQSPEDWQAIAAFVRERDPRIEPFVVDSGLPNSYTRRAAAARPTFVFSPGKLGYFQPRRGKVYEGRPIAKMEQLRLLAAHGVPVPRSMLLQPGARLDPAEWGAFVILKPSDLWSSSQGKGIHLMRTERVRYIDPAAYPEGHPGRLGPMIVQRFIDSGDRISLYRVLTLFGEPLYCQQNFGAAPRVDLAAPDEEIENAVVATQAVAKEKHFVRDADVLAVARAAHAAMPRIPLKGCDVIRDRHTGKLFVLEVNPGGNTWHFSSTYLAEARRQNGPEFEAERLRQFDALRTAARVLVERTNAEAS